MRGMSIGTQLTNYNPEDVMGEGLRRYFFNVVSDSRTVNDIDGEEFSDLEAARKEAVCSVRELVAEELNRCDPLDEDRSIEIRSEDGALLAAIPFPVALRGEH